ncbi:hypothetical protein EB796_006389 [Bugula neritina]|uniref:Uncharacterized protein n=1 Tax=Bugula neritina TaxID=10212 RepID=A0A7J7KAN1_BUGNE|nr:hypothetical protein EB796_006389 [Bugula neritina]
MKIQILLCLLVCAVLSRRLDMQHSNDFHLANIYYTAGATPIGYQSDKPPPLLQCLTDIRLTWLTLV